MTGTRRKVNRHGIDPKAVDRLVALPCDNAGWIALKRLVPERWPESKSIKTRRFSDGWNDLKFNSRIKSSKCTREDFMWCVACKLKKAWATPNVIGLLARVADTLSVLPILADALEEAGCYDETILSILRAS
jgi:hypothetical protein